MKPEEILTAAADKLEKMLNGVTPGEWYADWDRGVYAYGTDEDASFPDVVKGGAMSLEDTQWVAALGPVIGPDLIAHLRAAAKQMGGCCMLECPEHAALVRLAMQLVGLYGKPDSPHWDRGLAMVRVSAEERSDDPKTSPDLDSVPVEETTQ